MKRLMLSAVLSLSVFGASKTNAAPTWGAATNVVSYLFYTSGGWLYLKLANMQNPESCSSSAYLLVSTSDSRFRDLYATVVAAQASGSQVTVYYAGCDSSTGYPLIGGIASPQVW